MGREANRVASKRGARRGGEEVRGGGRGGVARLVHLKGKLALFGLLNGGIY